eukprot:jgi/Botrbrau1/9568/Bobra.0089s0022.1
MRLKNGDIPGSNVIPRLCGSRFMSDQDFCSPAMVEMVENLQRALKLVQVFQGSAVRTSREFWNSFKCFKALLLEPPESFGTHSSVPRLCCQNLQRVLELISSVSRLCC